MDSSAADTTRTDYLAIARKNFIREGLAVGYIATAFILFFIVAPTSMYHGLKPDGHWFYFGWAALVSSLYWMYRAAQEHILTEAHKIEVAAQQIDCVCACCKPSYQFNGL